MDGLETGITPRWMISCYCRTSAGGSLRSWRWVRTRLRPPPKQTRTRFTDEGAAPSADVSWNTLPQGFLTQPPVGVALNLVGSRTAYYRETVGLNTTSTFSPIFAEDLYITVMLLFGGIGAELEGLLQAGLYIKRVFYIENDPAARIAFGTRLRELHHKYPEQLGPAAFHTTQTSMP